MIRNLHVVKITIFFFSHIYIWYNFLNFQFSTRRIYVQFVSAMDRGKMHFVHPYSLQARCHFHCNKMVFFFFFFNFPILHSTKKYVQHSCSIFKQQSEQCPLVTATLMSPTQNLRQRTSTSQARCSDLPTCAFHHAQTFIV